MNKRTKYISGHVLLIFLLFLFPNLLFCNNNVKIGSVEVSSGEICIINIGIENSDEFTAFQTDISLPAGFTYVEGSAALIDVRSSGHNLNVSMLGSSLRIIAYSINNTPFIGNSGTLISFSLKSNTIPGDYILELKNTLLGNISSQNILTSAFEGSIKVLCPEISVSSNSINYGRVALMQTSILSLNISNTGNQNLIVTKLAFTDSQFTSPDTVGFTILPGDSKTIFVTYKPIRKGTLSKQLLVNSNDPDEPSIKVDLSAIGYTINQLHCGNIISASGKTATLDFKINNMEPFSMFQFDLQIPDAIEYIEESLVLFRHQGHLVQANMINDNTLRVIAYSLTAQNFSGDNDEILKLSFNVIGDAGYYNLNLSNVIIATSGSENILSDTFNGAMQITSSDIYANDQINFGDVSIIGEGNQQLTVYNYGQEQLIVEALTFNNNCFSSNNILPDTIQSGGSINLSLKFSKSTKGIAAGILQIFSNDPDENPFLVNLSGKAYVPNYLVLDTIHAAPGDTIHIPISIENLEDFVAFQFDLTTPAGIYPIIDSAYLTTRKQDHIIASTKINDEKIRIISWSPTQKFFLNNNGPIVIVPFIVDTNIVIGNYPLTLTNGLISSSQLENILYGVKNSIIKITEANRKPIARIDSNQIVDEGTLVNLDGSGSFDPDGDDISYVWTALDGIILSSTTNKNTSFTAPEVDKDTTYAITLVVNDGKTNSLPDTVNILVKDIHKQVPENVIINGEVYTSEDNLCIGAKQTIIVAGNETSVILESGSNINFIAGQSIIYLAGFHAREGSYMLGRITTNGTFCDGILKSSIVANQNPVEESRKSIPSERIIEEEKDLNSTKDGFILYPNPNNGSFVIESINFEEDRTVHISILNIKGSVLYQNIFSQFDKQKIELFGLEQGIYIVFIRDNKKVYTKKIIVN